MIVFLYLWLQALMQGIVACVGRLVDYVGNLEGKVESGCKPLNNPVFYNVRTVHKTKVMFLSIYLRPIYE